MSQALSGVRVLVVEDDDDLRATLVETLEGLGARAQEASGGWAAWDRLQSEPFDVVLTDVRMPAGDGLELIRRLGGRPPVVVIIGHADALVAASERESQPRFVPKPFTTEALVTALNEARAQS